METKGKPNQKKKTKTGKRPKGGFENKKEEIKTRITALKKIIGQLNIDDKSKSNKQ